MKQCDAASRPNLHISNYVLVNANGWTETDIKLNCLNCIIWFLRNHFFLICVGTFVCISLFIYSQSHADIPFHFMNIIYCISVFYRVCMSSYHHSRIVAALMITIVIMRTHKLHQYCRMHLFKQRRWTQKWILVPSRVSIKMDGHVIFVWTHLASTCNLDLL